MFAVKPLQLVFGTFFSGKSKKRNARFRNVLELLQRLVHKAEEAKKVASSLETRVKDMNKLAFTSSDLEQREKVLNFTFYNYYSG